MSNTIRSRRLFLRGGSPGSRRNGNSQQRSKTTDSMANLRVYDGTSRIEEIELQRSGRKPIYTPTEKIGIVEVPNFPMLGKLTALRFIEWVLKNPGGVISLPTGKTPEFFIKWVRRILEKWNSKEIQSILNEYGRSEERRVGKECR